MTHQTFLAGGYQGAASVHTRALWHLAAAIERYSDGDLRLTVTPDITGDGSKATDLLARVEAGTLDLCYFASSYLAARVPALAAFDLPFTASDRTAAYRQVDGALGRYLAGAVRGATGFTVLAFWDNGFRHLSNRLRPLAHPDDCAGVSIRTLDNALHQAMFASFGFRPVAIDVRDLADAVRLHRVDAQENPLTNTVNFGLHQTHRFHSLTAHVFGVALLLANTGWLDLLAPDARRVLDLGVAEATAFQRDLATAEDRRCRVALHESGAEILGPDDIDREAFIQAAKPVRDAAMAGFDDELRAVLQAWPFAHREHHLIG